MNKPEVICRRVDDNPRNLGRELAELRRQGGRLTLTADNERKRIRRYEIELANAQNRGGAGAYSRRRGVLSEALTVIGAVEQSRRISEIQAGLRTAQENLARIERELDDINRRQNDKLHVVRQQQGEWSRLDCFDLGFSHEVLNIH